MASVLETGHPPADLRKGLPRPEKTLFEALQEAFRPLLGPPVALLALFHGLFAPRRGQPALSCGLKLDLSPLQEPNAHVFGLFEIPDHVDHQVHRPARPRVHLDGTAAIGSELQDGIVRPGLPGAEVDGAGPRVVAVCEIGERGRGVDRGGGVDPAVRPGGPWRRRSPRGGLCPAGEMSEGGLETPPTQILRRLRMDGCGGYTRSSKKSSDAQLLKPGGTGCANLRRLEPADRNPAILATGGSGWSIPSPSGGVAGSKRP